MNKGKVEHDLSNIETVETILKWECECFDRYLKDLNVRQNDREKIEDYRNQISELLKKQDRKYRKLIDEMLPFIPNGEYTIEDNAQTEL